jgi:hypothetical protein
MASVLAEFAATVDASKPSSARTASCLSSRTGPEASLPSLSSSPAVRMRASPEKNSDYKRADNINQLPTRCAHQKDATKSTLTSRNDVCISFAGASHNQSFMDDKSLSSKGVDIKGEQRVLASDRLLFFLVNYNRAEIGTGLLSQQQDPREACLRAEPVSEDFVDL